MERKQYVCPKCGCTEYESDQFQATGGNFAKMFDIQNKRLPQYHADSADIQSYIRSQKTLEWIYWIF